MKNPSVTSTNHPLPFERLSPLDFERLCLWLVEREGYTQAQHLGAGGNEQGRDVTAYHGTELWYFQCKRYKELSSATLIAEVEKYNDLAARDASKKPHGIVFVTNAILTAKTREDLEKFCQQHGYACEFWAQTELDMRVKQHDAIVKEFFNLPPQSAIPNLQAKVSTHHLPRPLTPHLFGRDDELKLLDGAWAQANTNIIVFHAIGGAGKSALVSKWLAQMATENFRGATRVFGWSFFSQGAGENRSDSSEIFIDSLLRWFDEPEAATSNYFSKAERLAELMRGERTLLILDGLEPSQYPPNTAGLPEGSLKDRPLQLLLDALAVQQPGLCIVTSRERLNDLNSYENATVLQRPLDHLPFAAGAQLLRKLGVDGADDELIEAAKEFKGHAYGLTLLGSYLATVLDGDIRRRKEIANLFEDDRFGPSAEKMIAAYETWLGDGVEVAILRMLGLFDRPTEAASIAALRAAPVIPGLTEAICSGQHEEPGNTVQYGKRERPEFPATDTLPEGKSLTLPISYLSEVKWQQALAKLRRINLLSEAKHDLDAHPLVREYFRQQLKTKLPDAWQAGNLRLYEHLTRTTKEFPDTLAEMQPLFAAVIHGCATRKYQEVFNDVYWRRIQRGNEFFSTKRLGTCGTQLIVLMGFFATAWTQIMPGFNEKDQGFILNEVGALLHALGRLKEATQSIEAGLRIASVLEKWEDAARAAFNLSELFLAFGDLTQSLTFVRQCIKFADHDNNVNSLMRVGGRAAFGVVLYQSGRLTQAEDVFSQAELLQQKRQPHFPLLYGLQGYWYCELLLSQGKSSEVKERAAQTLEWAKQSGNLLPIALDNLSLGRVWLLQEQSAERDTFRQSAFYLQRALDGLRQTGQQNFLPLGLLAHAAWARVAQQYDQAHRDLTEARSIAERGEMRLHLCDYHLEAARLHLAQRNKDKARKNWATAHEMVAKMGYHRRDAEVEELKQQLSA